MKKLYVLKWSHARQLQVLILYYSLQSYIKQIIFWQDIMFLNETDAFQKKW